ncbi:MAG TPA: universal stress protein [Bradyrhizobium sp.]|nr:universal stress protein [Bradyrhizobium sp.]
MTLASVMVSLGLDQSNEARLELAGQLAEQCDAAVIGIAAAQFSTLYFTDGEMAQRLIEQGEAAIRKRLAELEAEFRQALRNRTCKSVEWRSALDFPTRHAVREARSADIIVTGGQAPALSDAFTFASPKDLVMQAGRPVLLVPDSAGWLDLRTVLVAWKDTPGARRAISDALPLLQRAKDVVIAEIPEDDDGRSAAPANLADVAAFLSRHGIVATTRVAETRGRGVTEELDEIAQDVAAGLIVAGAYGHSRFRELVLGGVTEHLVTQSSRCVLLSH